MHAPRPFPLPPQDIRKLDGPALTKLAFHAGLAPAEAHSLFDDDRVIIVREPETTEWEPHRHLWQAYAVFFRLRKLGFCAQLHYYPHDPDAGTAGAWRFPGGQAFYAHFGDDQDEECLALLRVACLAVAHLEHNEYT